MLPWNEKYRPHELTDMVLPDTIRALFNSIITNNMFPNMLFYGPPGTGKTSTILCILKNISSSNIIHLNASDERGIDVIRNQLYTFIHSNGMFQNEIKIIVLDEVDSMTKQAQTSLLSLFNNNNVRFCLICNYISKLIPQLRDYLLLIPFYNTINNTEYIQNIIQKERLQINNDVIDDIIFNYYPDLRSVVNCLQAYQSFQYPLIKKDIIELNCKKYKTKVKNYIKTVCFKEYLYKLFMHMLNYNIDSKLIFMMKDLILIKQDIDYFETFFMPYFKQLN
jgi:DNA polymerase III delta prime subunit